MSLALRGATIG